MRNRIARSAAAAAIVTAVSIGLDHFRWDAQIDPSLFEPDIPADYTLSGPR